MRTAGSLGLTLLLLPSFAHAAILINEIAWMGTTANANAEWIELANTGTSNVDLSGWTIVSSSGSPTITLAGTISAGGYFLLERTSDSSVPTVTADQIYTGALTNSGATLTLADTNGTTVDAVVGGTNWADAGGDNLTKDTAQRADVGWQTAAPTPRAVNVGVTSGGSSPSNSSSSATSTDSGASSGSMAYSPPTSSLALEVGPNITVFTHVPTRLSAQVKNKNGEINMLSRVRWSFGDGSSAEGDTVQKVYDYVGTYLVTAEAEDGTFSARDEVVVTVTTPAVQIIAISSEGAIIRNDARVRLNLSGWRLSDSSTSFQMPEGTVILPNAQVFFPTSVTHVGSAQEVLLTYPNGTTVARYTTVGSVPAVQPLVSPASSFVVQEVEPVAPAAANIFSAHEKEIVSAPRAEEESEPARGAPVPERHEESPSVGALSAMLHSPWTLGFFGLLAAAGGVLMIL